MNSRFFIIISLSMTVAYIIFGLFIAFFGNLPSFSNTTRYLFGAFIISYGIFRGYRALKLHKARIEEQQKSDAV